MIIDEGGSGELSGDMEGASRPTAWCTARAVTPSSDWPVCGGWHARACRRVRRGDVYLDLTSRPVSNESNATLSFDSIPTSCYKHPCWRR